MPVLILGLSPSLNFIDTTGSGVTDKRSCGSDIIASLTSCRESLKRDMQRSAMES